MSQVTTIGGRFEVDGAALTKSGGMGTVVKARDRHTGELVALKILADGTTVRAERFAREAALLSGLSHPAIVRYVAHGAVPGGAPYLAMEWLEGETLGERLARGRLPLREALALGVRVAEALAEAHRRGVVHRDIKPPNLLLPDGDAQRVKVLDFGIALRAHSATLTGLAAIGTPGYMAPEQARGGRDIDGRADVFSLGCVLYECVTGQPAFRGAHWMALLAKILVDDPAPADELVAGLPDGLSALLARMMAKDPAQRPRDVGEVALALGAALRGQSIAGGDAAGGPPAAPAVLLEEELRVSCVVMVGGGAGAPALEDAEAALRVTGGAVYPLADGSLFVSFAGTRGGAATDLAGRAARGALALRSLLARKDAERPLALGMGRQVGPGEVIERAAVAVRRAAPGVIAVDDETAALLDARFDVQGEPGALFLAGERAWETARTLLGRVTPCVGRERELATLEAMYAECVSDQVARVVLVTAPAGLGKSRLCHELLRRLDDGQSLILPGRGDPLSAGSPFGLLGPAIRRLAGADDGTPTEKARARLTAFFAGRLPAAVAQRATEFLGELCQLPAESESEALRAARADAMLMGDAMRAAWEDWLRAECQIQPVVVVLEDLHWGDLPSAKFVDAALRNLRDHPLFVVALARPEVAEVFPGLWEGRDLQHVRLAPLTKKAGQRLVREALGDSVPEDTVESIVLRAEGNAFFLEELVRAVAAGGDPQALPDTVLGTVEARLDSLGSEARRVLRAGSIFGRGFTRDGVFSLLGDVSSSMAGGSPPPRVVAADEWLEDLVRREVLVRRRGDDAGYGFRNALVRDAAYAMLTEADRIVGHRLAAGFLEHRGAEPLVLAEHWDRGGEPARAAGYYRRAAEQALRGNDLAAAIASAERGIACGAEGELYAALRLVQAEALRWRGESAAAAARADEASRLLVRGSALWFLALGELVVASARVGDNDRVEAYAREAAGARPATGALSAQITCLCRGAAQLTQVGRHAAADVLLVEVDAACDELQAIDRLAQARLHRVRAKRALHAGDAYGFLVGQERAVAAFDMASDARNACSERGELGFAYAELGDFERAEAALREALAAAEHLGLHHVAPWAWNNLGLVLARKGDLAEGERVERLAVDTSVAQGDRRLEGGSRIELAIILDLAGDATGAEREARLAIEALENAPPRRTAAQAMRARALLTLGRAAEALPEARAAKESLERLGGIEEGEALVRLVYAEALDATGDRAAARAAIADARAHLERRAALVTDAALREMFLTRLPDHARTVALAEAWA